ncbi:MAG: DHCW motif cupin fold protein [Cyclobacteriaceae bacterium]
MNPIPFETLDWNTVEPTKHPGEKGMAYWKTKNYGGLRIRMVEYSSDYLADHWCEKGHILFCIKGELHTELEDGSVHTLKENMSYHVSDHMSKHKSSTVGGAKLFIIDGEFLQL